MMKIRLHLVNDDKYVELNLPKTAVASDTLKELNIPPDTMIITRNGQPIPLDSPLEPDDKLTFIRVISGG